MEMGRESMEDAIDQAAIDSLSYENEISRRKYIEEALRSEKATIAPQGEGLIERIEKNLVPANKKREISMGELTKARDVVLTLKPYLDEAERDIQMKHWENLQVYLFTFAEQEKSFSLLIDGLFPADDELDKAKLYLQRNTRKCLRALLSKKIICEQATELVNPKSADFKLIFSGCSHSVCKVFDVISRIAKVFNNTLH